ncbi:hypothetical protein D3C72_418750 [compost metagenome]
MVSAESLYHVYCASVIPLIAVNSVVLPEQVGVTVTSISAGVAIRLTLTVTIFASAGSFGHNSSPLLTVR